MCFLGTDITLYPWEKNTIQLLILVSNRKWVLVHVNQVSLYSLWNRCNQPHHIFISQLRHLHLPFPLTILFYCYLKFIEGHQSFNRPFSEMERNVPQNGNFVHAILEFANKWLESKKGRKSKCSVSKLVN